MATDEIAEKSRVEEHANVFGGDACVGTTRIPVGLLVQAKKAGLADEEQSRRFDPPLTRADLQATWAYYGENPEQIAEASRDNEEG